MQTFKVGRVYRLRLVSGESLGRCLILSISGSEAKVLTKSGETTLDLWNVLLI